MPLPKSLSILALGDSYTIGEGVKKEESYPFLLKQALELTGRKIDELEVIAQTGWTTEHLLKACRKRFPKLLERYDLAFLLIGVNNQYQEKLFEKFYSEFGELCEIARSRSISPEQIFVLSIPDYAFTPFGQTKNQVKISTELEEYNNVSRSICDSFRFNYIDLSGVSRQGLQDLSFLTGDYLHPSVRMYRLWVEQILNRLVL